MRFTSFIALSLVAFMVAKESQGVPLNKKEEADNSMAMMAGVGIAGAAVGAGAGFMGGRAVEKKNSETEKAQITEEATAAVHAEENKTAEAEHEKNMAENDKANAEHDKEVAQVDKANAEHDKDVAVNDKDAAEHDKDVAEAEKDQAEAEKDAAEDQNGDKPVTTAQQRNTSASQRRQGSYAQYNNRMGRNQRFGQNTSHLPSASE